MFIHGITVVGGRRWEWIYVGGSDTGFMGRFWGYFFTILKMSLP